MPSDLLGESSAAPTLVARNVDRRRNLTTVLLLTIAGIALDCCSDDVAIAAPNCFLVEMKDGGGDFDYVRVALGGQSLEIVEEGCDDRWTLFSDAEATEYGEPPSLELQVTTEGAAVSSNAREFGAAIANVEKWILNKRANVAVGCETVSTSVLVEVLLRHDIGWSVVTLPSEKGKVLRAPIAFRPGHNQVLLGVTPRRLQVIKTTGLALVDSRTGEVERAWESDTAESAVADAAFTDDGRSLAVLRSTVSRPDGLFDGFLRNVGHGRQIFRWSLEIYDLESGEMKRVKLPGERSSSFGRLLWVGSE